MIATGSKLGPYEIVSPLGAGGMGEVYRARDTRLERTVAIKVLPTHLSSNPDLRARFEREAKAISSLNHPHICTLHDVGHQDGTDFLVMEYLEGETLASRLEKGALPLKQALEYGIQIAEALEKAHKQGIVHRDLKPGNVMLTKSGAKLLDFGLAKGMVTATAGAHGSAPSFTAVATVSGPSPASPLTTAGSIVGTIQYMAPEQVEGKDADARSDIFSLGAVLYEMVAGKRAFAGKSQISVASAILEKDPEPISAVQPLTPPAFERVVATCLAKTPDDRFQTAHDLRLQLKWIAEGGMQPAGAASSRGSQMLSLRGLGILMGLLIVGGIVVAWKWPSPLPRVIDTNQITDDGTKKAGVYITGIIPAPIVTDGSRLYFLENVSGKFPMAQVSVNGGESAQLSIPFDNPGPSDISPNGSEILFFPFTAAESQEEVWSLPLPAGSPRRVGNLKGQDAAWAPDGKHIVYSAAHDIFSCNAEGANCKKLVTAPGSPGWMRWSPDGKVLRFSSYDSKVMSSSLWEVSHDGMNLHAVLPNWTQGSVCCGSWTPDGRYFVFQAMHNERSDIWAMREGGGLLHKSAPVQLTAGPLSFVTPVPSHDGNKLFSLGIRYRGELVRYDERAKEFVPFLGGMSVDGVTFSKDGKQVAYTAFPRGDLWRAKADGTQKLQLTFLPMRAFRPRWSPDGKKLLFSGVLPGSPSKIYTVDANGGVPEPVDSSDANEFAPDWSPQGDAMVYGGLQGYMTPDYTRQPLRIFDLKSRQTSGLPGSEGFTFPRWSPDGRYIAALTNGADKMMLYDFSSKQWQVAADFPVASPAWSKDGEYLFVFKTNVSKTGFVRIRMSDRRLEPVADLGGLGPGSEMIGGSWWSDITPDNSPMVLRDRGSSEIYALQWELP